MTGQLRDTVTARRADYGAVRLGQRDIDGLILCAEHYGAPYDLLAAALGAQPARLRAITARWRAAGYAATGRLGPGPGWCWLTPAGMAAAGFGYRAGQPSLARLAHIRAVLAARLWLSVSPAWAKGRPWWQSERRIRAAGRARPDGRARAGRRDPLAQHRHQPLPGAGVGGGGRADSQATGTHQPDHGRAAVTCAVRAGAVPDRAARPAGRDPVRGTGPRRSAGPDHHPGPAPGRAYPRASVMTVMAWLRLTLSLWLLRKAVKLAGWLLLALLALALWPVTIVTIVAYTAAWLRGWPPARLRRAAAATLTLPALYAVAVLARQHGHPAAALAPARAYPAAWHHLAALGAARTFLALAPAAVPAGLALAAGLWAWRNYAITAGIGGRMASAPVTFDNRQWKRQARAAEGRTAAPGSVPLLTRRAMIPVGGTIRAVACTWKPVFAVPAAACGRHMVIIGASGSGKTNLMMRLWAGWYTATLDAFYAGQGDRPLLIVLDCKGGRDARRKADRTRRLLYGAGARHVALWPDEARVSIWDLPAPDLAVLLYQMVETGTGNAAYYADILYAVTVLAVTAPPGPPYSAAAFLERLDPGWLDAAWGSHPAETARVRSAARHIGDIQLRYATLLGRLGPALDGPGTLDEADAWYFILEGTREPSVAEAQALALTELAARAATSPAGQRRAIVLAADDYSAVSRRVPLSNLYERGRSLGIGVQVSAQTWQGLGADEDERYRIAGTADGGVWVMHTPYPEPLSMLAGTRRVLETAHTSTTQLARGLLSQPEHAGHAAGRSWTVPGKGRRLQRFIPGGQVIARSVR